MFCFLDFVFSLSIVFRVLQVTLNPIHCLAVYGPAIFLFSLESRLRFECPWLAETENSLLLEALIDNAFPIEYAFVLEVEDARQK